MTYLIAIQHDVPARSGVVSAGDKATIGMPAGMTLHAVRGWGARETRCGLSLEEGFGITADPWPSESGGLSALGAWCQSCATNIAAAPPASFG
jgi:hypothetical protein